MREEKEERRRGRGDSVEKCRGEGGDWQEENSQWAEVMMGETGEGRVIWNGMRRGRLDERKGTDWHRDDSNMSRHIRGGSCKRMQRERRRKVEEGNI